MSVNSLANEIFNRHRPAINQIRQRPFQGMHEYLNNEINNESYLSGDLRNTQENEEQRISKNHHFQKSSLPKINIRSFLGIENIDNITKVINPPAQFSKAYLRLERIDAEDDLQNNTILWNISIGISNYIKGTAATKILLENMQSARLGTMVFPTAIGGEPIGKILFKEWQTQSYQNTSGPVYQFIGDVSIDFYEYRSILNFQQSATSNIQERNEYLNRRGYSGTWVVNNQIDRIEKLSMQMMLSNDIVPLNQLYAKVTETDIGLGGSSIIIETANNHAFISDPYTVFITGFMTDDPRDNANCSIINRLEGWQAYDSSYGYIILSDYRTSMSLMPYTRIALQDFVFYGTPMLENTMVMIGLQNTSCDLELTLRLNH